MPPFARALPLLFVALAHVPASPAAARTGNPRFMRLGGSAEAPRGFIEMCRTGPRLFCSETKALGDATIVTAALASSRRTSSDAGSPSVFPRLVAPGDARAEMKLVRRVNRYVNARVAQRSDIDVYGVAEHWDRSGTGPRAVGDCEDIAIEKRIQLIAAGFPQQDLSFAVVYSRDAGLHTVLVARLPQGDKVLDSRSDRVVDWSDAPYRWLSVQSSSDAMIWQSVGTAS